jgi:Fungal specific transcription factor domain
VLEDTLRQLIPMKPVADTLVQTYIDRFEIIHRVINIPAFITDYNRHWVTPLSSSALFLAQLLLVAAAAASFHPEICNEVTGQQTIYDCAVDWIEAAESWLNFSTYQFPQSWNTLATHCLLLIAKRTNYIQEGSFWTYTGAMVRRAMAAGYHREASPTATISPYYREMRRRLWMTIVELDIQASVDRGMPPNIRIEDFNVISPLNIDDDKLQDSSQDTLKSMPLATFTETSFQAHMHRSLPVRLKICALVNGCRDQHDFEQVLHLEEELEESLQHTPEWKNPLDNPRQQRTTMYVKRLLGIYLHQYTILLNMQLAIQGSPSFKSTICRRARLEASLKVLDHHQKLIHEEQVPEQACRTGLVLAAVNICHEIYMNFGPHGKQTHSSASSLLILFA